MTSAVTSIPLRLGPADHLDGARGRDVRDVDPRAGVPGEHDVARDDRLLGDAGPAGQPEPAGHLALVAAGVGAGEARVLRVLGDDAAEGLDVLERAPHDAGVVDAVAVVGEDPHGRPRARHETELGELGAVEALGHGAHRHHLGQAAGTAEVEHPLGGFGRVGDGARVGHREDGGVAARCRGRGPGGDGLGVLAAGLAQVHVEVDEARQGDETVGVEHLDVAARAHRADLADDAVLDEQVGGVGAEQAGATDQQAAHRAAPSVTAPAGLAAPEPGGVGVSSPASRW